MTDMLSAIQNTITTVNSAMAALPDELSAEASTGDFASVLARIQQSLGLGSETSPSSVPSALTGGLTNLMTPEDTNATTSTPTGAQVVGEAQQFLGVPYVWGGSSPQGFDCSGLVQYVYAQLGVNLPRTSEEQATVGAPVAGLADAQPGDLLFFAGSDGTASAPGHVGIYVGNDQMIDAPQTGETVQVQSAGDPVAIRRVLPAAASAPTAATNSSIPAALQPLFLAATSQYGLPAGLLPAVASVESNFQNNETSSAGAEGIMQIMPGTAVGLGINPTDPAQAIDGAASLLSSYLKQFGSVPLALAAYNAGPAAVTAAGGVPPYPETQAYVQNVVAQMGSLQ